MRPTELLEKIPHSQYVVTIPKMLRVYFKHDRKLLGLLSRSFYQALKEFFREASEDRDALPGVIISIQTYGRDPVVFHPHCLATDGTISAEGRFYPIAWIDTEQMMRLFRHRLLQGLLAEEKITHGVVDLLLGWRHPGFSVYRGDPVQPDDTAARERLASYIVHPPFALDRLHYDPEARTVRYQVRRKGTEQNATADSMTVSSALDWLAAVVTHIPDKGQQLLRYYGHYSNVRQAQWKHLAGQPLETITLPAEQEDEFGKQCRRDWAWLIRKIYEVDPLACPRCHGLMKIISIIEDPPVIKRILLHLHLWEVPKRSPPARSPPRDFIYDLDFFSRQTG